MYWCYKLVRCFRTGCYGSNRTVHHGSETWKCDRCISEETNAVSMSLMLVGLLVSGGTHIFDV